jgi:hypothetical protein
MKLSASIVAGGAFALAVVGGAACTAPAIPNDVALPAVTSQEGQGADAEPPHNGTTTTSSADAAPVEAGVDGGADASPPASCSASPTKGTCYDCCDAQNPKSIAFLEAAFERCLCAAPGFCKNECATSFCAGQKPTIGGQCDRCLSDNGDFCGAVAETLCATDAECKKLYQCDDASKCGSKPKN